MKFIKSLCLLLFLMIAGSVYGQLPQTGLYFYAHGSNIDKRTSLVLNEGEFYKLEAQDNFTLEFDFYLRAELIKFGYIFRIISNTDENFDFIINNNLDLFFVTNNQATQLKNIPAPEEWGHVSISFDNKKDNISLRFNGETMNYPYNLDKIRSLGISFGQCDFKNFQTSDVSPFILKNVQISNNSKALHYWPLDKHGEDIVFDELKYVPAIAHHPHWLMDNRVFWKKVAGLDTDAFPQITFDSISNSIYILKKNELVRYALMTDSTTIFPSTIILGKLYNQLLFDPVSGKLLFYGFNSGKINWYDFGENAWANTENQNENTDHTQHNRYISRADSSLYLFGGYGQYRYNSYFFRVQLDTQEQTAVDFSNRITPRYLAAMGGNKAGDKVYILGGRGAEMGRQELSPKNFSDFFEVNLKTNEVKLLFDLANKDNAEENVYSNSLVMAENDSCFYVLAYPNSKYSSAIKLKEININTQEIKTLADSIEFYFRDVTAYCDLYFSPRLSKLIAVAAYASDDQANSRVDIYTLDFPPLRLEDVIQADLSTHSDQIKLYLFVASLCILMLLFVFGRKLFSFGKKPKNAGFSPDPVREEQEDLKNEESKKEKSYYDFKTKSILFLGGFQVFDKDGKNITGEFTPTLKYILVLIVLYTLKNNKGISSSRLQELLWFDKTEEAARNNRSVNVRKLRVLLQSLGAIDITNENSYWTISPADDILLDYKEALGLIQKIQKTDTTTKEDLLRLLELLDSGPMLPNIQFEWVDNFKTDFSNAVIDVLIQIVNNRKNSFYDNQDARLRISDCILKIDPINEEALVIKCNTLYAMGKKSLAKTAFDNFTKEYQLLLGEPYQGSIKNFIGQ